uniref:Dipeptidyl aminopeptidase-like protein 6 n=1 Tax=Parastrongyloides trichosuri TaxID=131310 RepID=A0A0N4ZI81_PARTI
MIKEGTGKELLKITTIENEFTNVEQEQKNWKGISIALGVIFLMCLIIILCVLLLTPFTKSDDELKTPVNISDILEYNLFLPYEVRDWLGSNQLLIKYYGPNITAIDVNKIPFTTKEYIRDDLRYKYNDIDRMCIGKDDQMFIITKNPSDGRTLKIFDPEINNFIELDVLQDTKDKYAFICGPLKNQFAFVKDNDIYVKLSDEENVIQITKNTELEKEYIFNGITDWMYMEEIFQKPEAMWWSKNGDHLAFLTLNDTNVYRQTLPLYRRRIYPTLEKIFYPKVSDPNLPVPTLNVWSKKTRQIKSMRVILSAPNLATYLYFAQWHTFHGKEYLLAVWANRIQNVITVTICSVETGDCVPNFEQKYVLGKRKLNAEPQEWFIRHSTDNAYFAILPRKHPDGNIFSQVAKIYVSPRIRNGHEIFLQQGPYDVTDILHVDKSKNILYFLAAAPDPKQQHIYAVSIITDSLLKTNMAECITCDVFPECTYQEAKISPNGENIVIQCRGMGLPRTFIAKIDSIKNYSMTVQDVKVMEEVYNSKILPRIVYDEVTLEGGSKAYVEMLIPNGYSLDSKVNKLPVIVDVYGGPGVQKVTENVMNFKSSMSLVFASQREYVVIFIDGRGGMNRGWNMREPRYGNFGTVEVNDTIEATKRLLKKYTLLDSTKVGIWGWSYGGFLTAKVIQNDDDDVFKCGASIAPVTNFLYYDAAYTERYMGYKNNTGYIATDLTLTSLHNYKNKKFLIAHGSGDDNVHLQNTMNFALNLISQNIDFDMMVYPDDRHGIYSGKKHLYIKLDMFFTKCFSKKDV